MLEVIDAARHALAVVGLLFEQRVRIRAGDRGSAGSNTVWYPKSWMHVRARKEDESAGHTDAASSGSSNHLFFFY